MIVLEMGNLPPPPGPQQADHNELGSTYIVCWLVNRSTENLRLMEVYVDTLLVTSLGLTGH